MKRKLFLKCSLLFYFFSLIILSAPLHARTTFFSIHDFRPNPGKSDYFSVWSSDTLLQGQFSAGLFNTYAWRPFQLVASTGARSAGVIDSVIAHYLTAAISPMDWWQIGIDMPIHSYIKLQPIGTTGFSTHSFDLGDPRLTMKFRILDPNKYRVGIAVLPFVTAPLGKDSKYVADSKVTGGGVAVFDFYFHPRLRGTLNAGGEMRELLIRTGLQFDDRFLYGGGLTFLINNDFSVFVEGLGSTPFRNFFQFRRTSPSEVNGGLKWDIKETGFTLTAGGGTCIVCGLKGPKIRGSLALDYRYMNEKFRRREAEAKEELLSLFGKSSPEVDVASLSRNCPANPENFDASIHDSACPKYYELRSVANLSLNCPANPENFDASIHSPECQKVFSLQDYYNTGEISQIYTLRNKELEGRCPANPSGYIPGVHDQNCPKFFDLQSALATYDQCPDDPANYDPGIHSNNCPKVFELQSSVSDAEWEALKRLQKSDSDLDGISDYLDDCPLVAGPKLFRGCPEAGDVTIESLEIVTKDPIFFKFNSTRIPDEVVPLLGKVADTIMTHPEMRHIEIHGHADGIGSLVANQRFAEKRAKVIANYLRLRGVPPSVKLEPVAFGSKIPVASNKTERGRAENRRVVLIVVPQSGQINRANFKEIN